MKLNVLDAAKFSHLISLESLCHKENNLLHFFFLSLFNPFLPLSWLLRTFYYLYHFSLLLGVMICICYLNWIYYFSFYTNLLFLYTFIIIFRVETKFSFSVIRFFYWKCRTLTKMTSRFWRFVFSDYSLHSLLLTYFRGANF